MDPHPPGVRRGDCPGRGSAEGAGRGGMAPRRRRGAAALTPAPLGHLLRRRCGALPPAPLLGNLHRPRRAVRPAAAAAVERGRGRCGGRGSGAVGLPRAEAAGAAGPVDAQGGRGRLRRPRGRARRPGHRPRRRLRLERLGAAGDLNKITLGFYANVQERCVLHAAWAAPTGHPPHSIRFRNLPKC